VEGAAGRLSHSSTGTTTRRRRLTTFRRAWIGQSKTGHLHPADVAFLFEEAREGAPAFLPGEAATLAGIVDARRKAVETQALEQRISALEEKK